MTSTRWAASVDALLAACRAAPALSAAYVSDGPRMADAGDFVIIGHDDAVDDDQAGRIDQSWHDTGIAARRDDVAQVRCAVASQDGGSDLASARSAAFALLGAVEAVIRSDPSLGMPEVIGTEVTFGTIRQGRTDQGVYCLVQFTVDITSVI